MYNSNKKISIHISHGLLFFSCSQKGCLGLVSASAKACERVHPMLSTPSFRLSGSPFMRSTQISRFAFFPLFSYKISVCSYNLKKKKKASSPKMRTTFLQDPRKDVHFEPFMCFDLFVSFRSCRRFWFFVGFCCCCFLKVSHWLLYKLKILKAVLRQTW